MGLYCSFCEKEFGQGHSHCPECAGWLTDRPSAAAAPSPPAGPSPGAFASTATDDWLSKMGGGAWSQPQEGWLSHAEAPQPASAWSGTPVAGPTPAGRVEARPPQSAPGGLLETRPPVAAPTAADRAGNDPARRVVISPAVGAGPAGRAVGTGPARRAMISAGAGSSRSNLWPWVVAAFLAVAVGVGGYLVRARAPEVEPPRAATADFVPQDFLENGRKAYEAGDYQKAIPQLEVALDVLAGPDQLKARKLLASALFKQGVYDKAEIHYKLLAAQDPSYKTWLAESRARGRTAARTRGQRALDNAEHALASGDRRSALSLGEEALAIFEDHGGSSQQMASARDVIERSRQSADRSADRPLAGQPLPEPGRPATTAPGTRAYPVARKAVPATPEPMLAPSDPSLAAPEPFAEPGVPGQEPQGTGAPPNRPASQAQARSQPDPLYTPSALQAKDGGRPPGY